MEGKNAYITVNHTEQYGGTAHCRVGDKLTLSKDHDNIYDDEAIAVYSKHNNKCGYVANSVCSVARGTLSAGRLYDRIKETGECTVRFILDERIIAELMTEEDGQEDLK